MPVQHYSKYGCRTICGLKVTPKTYWTNKAIQATCKRCFPTHKGE